MTDLKLIDELLCMEAFRMPQFQYRDRIAALAVLDSLHREAFDRLRQAWESGEMPVITAALAEHFRQDTAPVKEDKEGV